MQKRSARNCAIDASVGARGFARVVRAKRSYRVVLRGGDGEEQERLDARIEVTVGDVTDGARCLGHYLHLSPMRIVHEGRCDALEITLVPVVLLGLRALVV